MLVQRKNIHVPAVIKFATVLPDAPTAVCLLNRGISGGGGLKKTLSGVSSDSQPHPPVYLAVGKSNGQLKVYSLVHGIQPTCYDSEIGYKLPIVAICQGDLRNTGAIEVVAIQCSGYLQSFDYPAIDVGANANAVKPLDKLFYQQIYANVSACRIFDIDGDKKFELVVLLTDRVVRTYRYDANADHLNPLNKWEMLGQIMAWCFGFDGTYYNLIISLNAKRRYIIIDFGPNQNVHVQDCIIDGIESQPFGMLLSSPAAAALCHGRVERIVVDDHEYETEIEIRVDQVVNAMAACTFDDVGISIVVTTNTSGTLLIHAWPTKSMIGRNDPVVRCPVMPNIVDINLMPLKDLSFYVAAVDSSHRVAIYTFDLSNVVRSN